MCTYEGFLKISREAPVKQLSNLGNCGGPLHQNGARESEGKGLPARLVGSANGYGPAGFLEHGVGCLGNSFALTSGSTFPITETKHCFLSTLRPQTNHSQNRWHHIISCLLDSLGRRASKRLLSCFSFCPSLLPCVRKG